MNTSRVAMRARSPGKVVVIRPQTGATKNQNEDRGYEPRTLGRSRDYVLLSATVGEHTAHETVARRESRANIQPKSALATK